MPDLRSTREEHVSGGETTISWEDIHAEEMESAAYRQAWEESGPRMALAFAMVEARVKAGLTQAEIARRMGTSQARISRWERGAEKPTLTSIERFAAVTGARVEIRLIPPAS